MMTVMEVPTFKPRPSADAQRLFIIEKNHLGWTDAAIAEELGCVRSHVQNTRSKLGLPPRYGKVIPKFTEAIDADILFLRDDDELGWAAISRLVGLSANDVRERWYFLDQRRVEEEERKPVVIEERKCLGCRKMFKSAEPRKIQRMCDNCRETNQGYGDSMVHHSSHGRVTDDM